MDKEKAMQVIMGLQYVYDKYPALQESVKNIEFVFQFDFDITEQDLINHSIKH